MPYSGALGKLINTDAVRPPVRRQYLFVFYPGDGLVEVRPLDAAREQRISKGIVQKHDSHYMRIFGVTCGPAGVVSDIRK